MRVQQNTKSVDQYVTQLKSLANSCEFGNLKDSLIRNRLICGIKNSHVREKLLQDNDLNLQKAIEICRAAEVSSEQSKKIAACSSQNIPADQEVNVIRRQQGHSRTYDVPHGKQTCAVHTDNQEIKV